MDWCRLSTSYYLDAAVLRAGEDAEVLFVRCMAYSGAQETGGRVAKHALPLLTPTRTKARTAALVREGLLLDDGDHVLIRSWERWQEALDAESARRRRDRERKARVRSGGQSKDVSADSPRTVHVTKPRIEVEVEEEKETPTPKTSSPTDGFEEFWQVYPRREGKQAAVKAFGKARQSASTEIIVQGAIRFRDDPNRQPEFTPHPTTWLNQGRWDDDPLPARGLRALPSRVAEQDDTLRRWHDEALQAQRPELGA